MSSAKRLWSKLTIFFFLLVLLLSLPGICAPLLSPEILPLAQLVPAILMLFVPFQVAGIFYFRKRSRPLMLLFAATTLLSLWGTAKDWNWSAGEKAEDASFRVVSYNARNFNFTGQNVDSVIQLLQPLQPDVICFQEFRNYRVEEEGQRATQAIAAKMNMPYYRHFRTGKYFQGIAIFSHFPITRLDTLFMDAEEANNGLLATLEVGGREIGIANFHLSSFQFFSIHKEENTLLQQVKRLVINSSRIIPLHLKHTREVLDKLGDYPHPLILAADLNTVPHSYVVNQIRKRYEDSFRKKGNGIGWTYPLWQDLGVRIDYQFVSPGINVLSHQVIRGGNSDHFPILGVYRLPEINASKLSR